MKQFITKTIGFMLAFAIIFTSIPVTQVQAASKKVTASKYKENKEDYPDVTTGTYRIKVKSEAWKGTVGCVKFKAKKAGTYTFKLKDSTSNRLTVVKRPAKREKSFCQKVQYLCGFHPFLTKGLNCEKWVY